MRWFSLASLKALVSEITARENSNMQAVNDTFSEVYDNMETLDGRIDALEHKTDAAYLGNCYCGSVYLGYVSETDTQRSGKNGLDRRDNANKRGKRRKQGK